MECTIWNCCYCYKQVCVKDSCLIPLYPDCVDGWTNGHSSTIKRSDLHTPELPMFHFFCTVSCATLYDLRTTEKLKDNTYRKMNINVK